MNHVIVAIYDRELRKQIKHIIMVIHRKLRFCWLDGTQDLFDYLRFEKANLIIVQTPPRISDFTITVQYLHALSDAPILGLVENDKVDDFAYCLSLADDCVLVPLQSDKELIARCRALLDHPNCSLRNIAHQNSVLAVRNLIIYKGARRIFVNRHEVHLTKTEFDIMEYLLLNVDIVVTRQQIYSCVWQNEFELDVDETVRSHIKKLRKKLKKHTNDEIIETVRGVGYRISGAHQMYFHEGSPQLA